MCQCAVEKYDVSVVVVVIEGCGAGDGDDRARSAGAVTHLPSLCREHSPLSDKL